MKICKCTNRSHSSMLRNDTGLHEYCSDCRAEVMSEYRLAFLQAIEVRKAELIASITTPHPVLDRLRAQARYDRYIRYTGMNRLGRFLYRLRSADNRAFVQSTRHQPPEPIREWYR